MTLKHEPEPVTGWRTKSGAVFPTQEQARQSQATSEMLALVECGCFTSGAYLANSCDIVDWLRRDREKILALIHLL